jgi:transcriptional regulator with XRE-family HTH domain
MDVKSFVRQLYESGEKQVNIARKAGISQATVYKLLYTETKPTLDIIVKIANAYGKPIAEMVAAEEGPQWTSQAGKLSNDEWELIEAYRQLDNRRKERALGMVTDMAAVQNSSREREGPRKNSKDPNSKLKSNG